MLTNLKIVAYDEAGTPTRVPFTVSATTALALGRALRHAGSEAVAVNSYSGMTQFYVETSAPLPTDERAIERMLADFIKRPACWQHLGNCFIGYVSQAGGIKKVKQLSWGTSWLLAIARLRPDDVQETWDE